MPLTSIRTPGEILFGPDASKQLPDRAKTFNPSGVVVVTDPGLVKAGVVGQITDLLRAEAIPFEIFDQVRPDPDIESVDFCLKLINSSRANLIVGLGGGSALDVAKMAAALQVTGGKVADYVGVDRLPEKGLPTILLPTTSGTGSEVSPIAVLTERKEENMKMGVVSPYLLADVAIVDPLLTFSCPASVTAASGMDTLTHAIEEYTNKFASPIIDTLALEAITLVMGHLKQCIDQPENLEARQAMSLASLYGGLGLGPVNTAAVHALAYPLGGLFDIPHGLANSILLPYVLEFNRPACLDWLDRIARRLEIQPGAEKEDRVTALIENIKSLSREVGIPAHLCELKIPEGTIGQMAKSAMTVQRLLKNNPRDISLADAEQIYRNAYR
jgi:alcohol dehydrogenase class IV